MSLLRNTLAVTLLLAAILVPFALFGTSLDRWSIESLEGAGSVIALAMIVALLAADVVLPVPSSILSTMAGAILGLPLGAAASFLGMTIGCAVGYALGAAGRGAADRLVGVDERERLERLAARHGDWSLAVARPVPVLAEASVVLAGVASMRFLRFMMIVSLSNFGVSLAYAAVGAYAADARSFLLAFVGAVSLPAAAMMVVGRRNRAPRP